MTNYMFPINQNEEVQTDNYLESILNSNLLITSEVLFTAFTKCKINEQDKLELLLEKAFTQGIDIDVQQSIGMHFTLLHQSIYYGFSNIVEFLLDKGANPNIQDIMGDTPLHEVVESYTQPNNTSINTIELLIKKSDIELKNLAGYTPLQIAVKNNFPNYWTHTKIVKLLIQYGADMSYDADISDANINNGAHIQKIMSQCPLIQLVPKNNTELKALLILIKACKDNEFSMLDHPIIAKNVEEFLNWQISITPENSRFFDKHLSELNNLQKHLAANPNLIDVESMQNLNKTINSYSTLQNSLIFKIVKDSELHNKICDKNFKPHSAISEDLVDKFKCCGLKLTGETTEVTPETA